MIYFVSGLPGAAKSEFAIGDIVVPELLDSRRLIVTNLAVMFGPWIDIGRRARPGMVEALQAKYGEDFDVSERIWLLDDSQIKRFFAHRGYLGNDGRRVEEVLPLEDDKRFRLKSESRGHLFIIDEAHEHFGARDWATTGKEALSYLSQHRRCGDTVVAVSQCVGNVEKQFRTLSQKTIWLTNGRFSRWGWFRSRDVIKVQEYASTPPSPMEHPVRSTTTSYDRDWVQGLYDTARGVGVTGRSRADFGVRAKGLHWAWAVPMIVAAMLGLWMFFRGGSAVGGKAVGNLLGAGKVAPGPGRGVAPGVSVASVAPVPVVSPAAVVLAASPVSAKKVWLDKSLLPWAVAWMSSKDSNGVPQSAVVTMSDRQMFSGRALQVVNGGLLLDGAFLSTVPTAASNLTAGVYVAPAVRSRLK